MPPVAWTTTVTDINNESGATAHTIRLPACSFTVYVASSNKIDNTSGSKMSEIIIKIHSYYKRPMSKSAVELT